MAIELRHLRPEDKDAFLEGLKDWVGESPHWYSFLWQEGMQYEEMLELLRKETKGQDLPPGRVPHSMLYGFLNGKIIGRVSVRHTLNENLRRRGGHIGYAVAPRYRNKGYATQLTSLALEYCRQLGLTSVMVTCADNNVPSWKIIEHFQGRLEDKIWDDEDKEMIRRYWIDL